MDGGEQQFATEGMRVGEMSGREAEETLWRRATAQTSVVTQTEIKAFGISFDLVSRGRTETRLLFCASSLFSKWEI